MAYLRNTTINLLNLHYGLHALATNAGGVFFGATTPFHVLTS